MKTEDVLIKNPVGDYEGYILQEVYEYDREPISWVACETMLRLPRKITYFLDREKILEVRKTDFNDIDLDYYLVKLVDNTYLELVY